MCLCVLFYVVMPCLVFASCLCLLFLSLLTYFIFYLLTLPLFFALEKKRFRVEFVTYKWPEWLRRQSEKQRIIWGYKILFLDVLFPLNVDKVIYVDADQV